MPEREKNKPIGGWAIPDPSWGKTHNMATLNEQAMKEPHPKPGQVELNRIRESKDKQKEFEAMLLAAGRKDMDAVWEAKKLVNVHLARLEKEDPDNYAWWRDPYFTDKNRKPLYFTKM